ncbi:MAG: 3-hydroxybutyryl-CoA dehydrogenase [Elusimicrobia bacterium]|nr:3-hydroxybutyryl-CoA dehydrogenase [Elusimicrobiota bacterium]
MEIKNIAVIGGGTMGNGIVHVFALAGFKTLLVEVKQEFADRAMAAIKRNLERQLAKNVIAKEKMDSAIADIKTSVKLEDAADSDLVIEAVYEDMNAKMDIFKRLGGLTKPEAILATNTSSLSITQLASATPKPEKVIGMHFMNPVPMMKLVEVVRGLFTSDETCAAVKNLCLKLGKEPHETKDYPGFIANRLLMPMINEACYALMEGVAAKEDIDKIMELGMAHPMGPLTLADLIGLDVCLAIMETLEQGFSDSKYRPCPLLRKMVEAGRLGRKTGQGFYDYRKK